MGVTVKKAMLEIMERMEVQVLKATLAIEGFLECTASKVMLDQRATNQCPGPEADKGQSEIPDFQANLEGLETSEIEETLDQLVKLDQMVKEDPMAHAE
ncbi:hypothetical protein TYRP_018831 [Tyrophagus putrescentiae]|nr:hypothetical protein TYRP_018831 [Tyrophagus putrescentiae]